MIPVLRKDDFAVREYFHLTGKIPKFLIEHVPTGKLFGATTGTLLTHDETPMGLAAAAMPYADVHKAIDALRDGIDEAEEKGMLFASVGMFVNHFIPRP